MEHASSEFLSQNLPDFDDENPHINRQLANMEVMNRIRELQLSVGADSDDQIMLLIRLMNKYQDQLSQFKDGQLMRSDLEKGRLRSVKQVKDLLSNLRERLLPETSTRRSPS